MTELSLADARSVADRALQDAASRGVAISVAVVDQHGNLVFFARQPGSTLGSVLSSQAKALTSASFGFDTADLVALVQPGQPLYGLHTAAGEGRTFTPLPGAVALRDSDNRLLGAVGIGGAPAPELDHALARSAADQLIGDTPPD